MRYVFLKKGERFEIHQVETGIADTRRVQLLSGLVVGDEVALMRPLEFDGELPVPVAPPPTTKPRSSKRDVPGEPPPGPKPPKATGS